MAAATESGKPGRSRARKLLRGVAWAVLGTVTGLVLLVLVALAVAFTTPGQRWLQGFAVGKVNETISGKLELGKLDLRSGGWLRLDHVRLLDPEGQPVVSADRVEVHVDALAVIQHRIWVKKVELDKPELRIVAREDGTSNLSDAIRERNPQPKKPDEPQGKPWRYELDDLTIRDGLVDRRMVGDEKNALHVEAINVTGKAVDVPGDVRVALEATAQITSPEKTPLALELKAHGTGTTLDDQLDLERLHLGAGTSFVDASGKIQGKAAFGHLDARLSRALGLSLGAPLARDVEAHADATWKGDTAVAELRVPGKAGEAHLHATVKPDAKPLAYAATLELQHLDPHDFVTTAPEGDLNAELAVDGHGTSPEELVADLQARVHASKVQGIRILAAEVKGHVADQAATLPNLDVELPGGKLSGSGHASRTDLDLVLGANVPDLGAFTANLGAMPPYIGSAEAAVHVDGSPSAPSIELALTSPRVANPEMDFDLHNLHVDARVPDARKPTVLSAHLRSSRGHFQDYEIVAFGGDVNLDGKRFKAVLQSAGETQLTLRTNGELPDPHHVLTIAALDIGIGEVAWTLAGPARVDLSHGARVDHAELSSGEQKIVLEGGLVQKSFDARLQLEKVDLAKLPKLVVPARLGLEGQLTASLEARGPKADPKIDAHLEAKNFGTATIARRTRSRITGVADATVSHMRLNARAEASMENNHISLDLDAPLSPRLRAETPLSGHVRADGIDLALLAEIADQPPRSVQGHADFDITLSGTFARPTGNVALALHEVKAQRSPPVNGTVKLALADRAKLDVDVHAGKGALTGHAELPLPADPLRHPERLKALRSEAGTVDLALRDLDLDQWRMQFGIPPDADGIVTAQLKAHGTSADPRGTLHLEVHRLVYGAYRNLDARADLVADGDVTAKADLALHRNQPVAQLQAKIGRTLAALIQRPAELGSTPVELDLTAGLDLAEAQGPNARTHGKVSAKAALKGTLDAPELHATFQGSGLAFSTAPLGDANGQLDYARGRTTLRATMPHFALDARADQQLGLTAAKGLDAKAIPVAVTLKADRFDLATLSGISQSVSTLGGYLTADASVQGPVGDPAFRGNVALDEGKIILTGFGDYQKITLRLAADNQNVKLSQLEVHSGDGVLRATADATRPPNGAQFALTGQVHAEKFPIESDDQTVGYVAADAKVDGQLASRDSLINIRFSQVHADIPTLKRKDVQKLTANPDIVILGVTRKSRSHAERATRELDRAVAAAAATPADGQAVHAAPSHQVRVGIFAPSDFWLRGQDINVDLRAALGIRLGGTGDSAVEMINPPGRNEPSTVEVVRGKLEVFGRRFDVPKDKPVKLTFEGGDPQNATIDAALLFNDRTDNIVVTVKVDGPVSHPNPPQLTSDPPMDPSQLALLIATGHLQAKRGTGQVSATSAAGSVVGSFVAGQLQNTLAKTLPIDTISIETGSSGQIRAEVGKYISDKIYVGYTRNFAAQANPGSLENQQVNINEFTLQYQLTRRWQLEAVGGDVTSGLDAIWQKDY